MFIVVGLYSLLMLASLVYAQASAAKLTAERCSPCHGTERICDRLGKRTADVWQQTVKRMVSNGAKLTQEEASTVSEYLTIAKPGSKHLCK